MRTCELYMQLDDDEWMHSAPHPAVCKMYSDRLPIYKVRITEDPDGGYWGWWENKANEFRYTSKVKAAVEICFPYGTTAEEERGRGQLVRVKIENIGAA